MDYNKGFLVFLLYLVPNGSPILGIILVGLLPWWLAKLWASNKLLGKPILVTHGYL